MSDNWLLILYCKWRCRKRGPRYARLWNSEQTILSKSWRNLIYLESVNDSSRNFSSLVSSGCKNVSNSSFANSFSSSDGMCHWMFRLKRSPGFPQSYMWRTEIQIYKFTTIKKVDIELDLTLCECGCFSVTNTVIAKWLEDWFRSYETRNDLRGLAPEIAKPARNLFS